MDIHSSDECQKYWRDRFADQLDEAQKREWGLTESDEAFQTLKWFRQGINYAAIVIRWHYDDEASS